MHNYWGSIKTIVVIMLLPIVIFGSYASLCFLYMEHSDYRIRKVAHQASLHPEVRVEAIEIEASVAPVVTNELADRP